MPEPVRSLATVLVPVSLAAGLMVSAIGEASAQSWAADAFGDGFDSYRPFRQAPAPRAMQAPQYSFGPKAFPSTLNGGPRPVIEPLEPEQIAFAHSEPPGTVLIDTEAKRLYLTLENNQALVYPISVGRDGFTWTGTEQISRIAEWPDWYPPAEMRQRDRRLPYKMAGGIRNPLGAVAMFLGNTLYRIHGTNDPETIGQAASSGCFRMLNGHAVHLASKVEIGTVVKVLPHVNSAPSSAKLPPVPEQKRQVAQGG
jgi:lipoprotein-anchoring transpeptidase ErfK/SrfK